MLHTLLPGCLQVSAAVMERVVGEGYSEEWGARQLRRTVTRLIEDPLSDAILNQEVLSGDIAYVDCLEDGTVVAMNKARVEQPSEIVYSSAL